MKDVVAVLTNKAFETGALKKIYFSMIVNQTCIMPTIQDLNNAIKHYIDTPDCMYTTIAKYVFSEAFVVSTPNSLSAQLQILSGGLKSQYFALWPRGSDTPVKPKFPLMAPIFAETATKSLRCPVIAYAYEKKTYSIPIFVLDKRFVSRFKLSTIIGYLTDYDNGQWLYNEMLDYISE